MSLDFVHLHVHSEYSLVDSVVRIPALVAHVRERGMQAVALTDQGNVFAAIKFYRAAQTAGLKPLIGSEIWIGDSENTRDKSRLVFLCKDLAGYRNLSALITRSYREGQRYGIPMVNSDWLTSDSVAGLIALSGGLHGDVGMLLNDGNEFQARRRLQHWISVFDDRYYIELVRNGKPSEDRYIEEVLDLAEAQQVPVVATNDVRFLEQKQFGAHEARVCIHEGRVLADPRRSHEYTAEQYLRDPQEMCVLFEDIPEAIENSCLIAKRCNLTFEFETYHLPEYPVSGGATVDEVLTEQSRLGLRGRIERRTWAGGAISDEHRAQYDDRLMSELDVIMKMGFSGYFLIVADFIQWAKDHDIPVGPGRGSGAGSLASYALGITELDPLQYDLLFERFLNPERISMPDFDIDFCMDRRDEVIEYVASRYGREKVAQIITHGTMAAKGVVRDVGRVLGFPYGFVDQLAKLIPFDPKMTLRKALDDEPALLKRYQEEDDVRAVIDLAQELEGLVRNAGKHAGGVVIAPSPLVEFMPLYCEQGGGAAVTQFDMSDVEAVGLVKFDFLGLRTLTIIDWAVRAINAELKHSDGAPIDISQIPLDDQKTYELIQRASTTAVFQLESRGMKDLIKRLQPDCLGDLIALVALFRPGPLQSGMVDDFIDRKHGRAAVQYSHPLLENILAPTYGVILYQEQVMQIAQVLAGYTLGAADLLRRAMGKKKPEEMAKQREAFVGGSAARGIQQHVAAQIFDLMEKFAGYGFNKSHSAAYALVAYQTAWLKTHYPAAFMAAVLSADMDTTDKVVRLIEECRHCGIGVEPPDINVCAYRFTVASATSIRHGLGSLKGIGETAISDLVRERDRGGAYRDLFDLCRRSGASKINRRVLEALIKGGALDCFGSTRRGLMGVLETALQVAEQHAKAAQTGQGDMFGLGGTGQRKTDPEASRALDIASTDEWSKQELLKYEKETLGLYLSGHPIDRYEDELTFMASSRLSDLKSGHVQATGLILEMRMTKSRRGPMAILTLDDNTGRVEITVYNKVLEQSLDKLIIDNIIFVDGICSLDEYSGEYRIVADRILGFEEARNEFARSVVLKIDNVTATNGFMQSLHTALSAYRNGSCAITIVYSQHNAQARIRLDDDWRVVASDALLETLKERFGAAAVRVEY